MHRRRFLKGLAALSAGCAIWAIARNRFTLVNESGQLIRSLSVAICGDTFHFADLAPGGSVSSAFGSPEDDDLFEVCGQFSDGHEFHEWCGYVAWEEAPGRRCRLAIDRDGVASCSWNRGRHPRHPG